MSATISDIANLANVSKSTVSAVLNGRPGISDKTRKKVLEIVKRLDYHPSQVARSLSTSKTRNIGLVIKEIDNPYFSKVMKGVFDACSQKGYTVLLGSSELDLHKELASIQALRGQRVDGLILSPLQSDDADFFYLTKMIQDKYPFVTLGKIPNFHNSVIEIDNVKAMQEGMAYLISQGHERIAFIAGPSHSGNSRERFEGYKLAMIQHGLSSNIHMIHAGSFIEDGVKADLSIFKRNYESYTAAFCYNDLVAIGLVNHLIQDGIQVPEDVSVIGFDNIPFSQFFTVPLTTVSVPAYEMGKAAAELLIRQIESEEPIQREHTILDATLEVRDSVSIQTNVNVNSL